MKIKITLLFFNFIGLINYITAATANQIDTEPSTDIIRKEWVSPENQTGRVSKFEKLELGFSLEEYAQGIMNFRSGEDKTMNPFDPEVFDCYVIFTHPESGKSERRNAFYFDEVKANSNGKDWKITEDEFPWRVRFCPAEIGRWSAEFYAVVKGKKHNAEKIQFEVLPSDKTGYLTAGDNYLEYTETGEKMFAVGHNLYFASFGDIKPENYKHFRKAFKDLSAAGANFTRIELGAHNALPDFHAKVVKKRNGESFYHYPEYDNYFSKMAHMFEFDQVIDICDTEALYFTLFRHHTELGTPDLNDYLTKSWDGNGWAINPYRLNLNLETHKDYFTNQEAIKWQNNNLRYVMARWGYTPKFTFYSYSEIDGWANKINDDGELSRDDVEVFYEWVDNQKKLIREELNQPNLMFLNTYVGTPKFELKKNSNLFYDNDDIIGIHKYTNHKAANYSPRFELMEMYRDRFSKPVFIEEAGFFDHLSQFDRVRCCTSIDFQNMIWGSSMMGSMGVPMAYWWPSIHSGGGHLERYTALAKFISDEFFESNGEVYKWKNGGLGDKKFHNRKPVELWNTSIENYNMVSDNKEKAVGWVHNSTHFWRNYYEYLPCIKEIADNKGVLSNACTRGDGSQSQIHPLEPNVYDFNKKSDQDKFTQNGGAKDVGQNNQSSKRPKETFKVQGLKASVGTRHYYQVTFYFTNPVDGIELKKHPEIRSLKTDIRGNLNIPLPLLNFEQPSLAYRIEYIGTGKEYKAMAKTK